MPTPDFSPAFQVDTDNIGSVLAYLGYIDIQGQTVTFTTADPAHVLSNVPLAHRFAAGQQVEIKGLPSESPDDYSVFNGVYTITAASGSKFSIHFASGLPSISVDAIMPGTWTEAQALSPPPSFVRFYPHDTLLDPLLNVAGSHTTFNVDPWDYNTLRIVWSTDFTLDARAEHDIGLGLTPLMVITRSGFGYPTTPLDGQRILIANYADVMTSPDRPQTSEYFETQAALLTNDWNRPSLPIQGLYDRNLQPGKWFYYSMFFYLGGYDSQGAPLSYNPVTGLPSQFWVLGNSMDMLTPLNAHHGERLYELLPEYYQMKDQEFLAGTGRSGVVQRIMQTVGFEADFTKTLADGLEHVYDIDHVHDDLMHSLGIFNFGIPTEAGLGDIRYRSLLSVVSSLYEERGSASGLQKMTAAATKYRCKVIEGINMMNLTDDAEFAYDTGSWANPIPLYANFLHTHNWLGNTVGNFNAVRLTSDSVLTTPEGAGTPDASLVLRRNAMWLGVAIPGSFDSDTIGFDDHSAFDGLADSEVVAEIPFDDTLDFDFDVPFDGQSSVSNAVLITCGLGEGTQPGRRHEPISTSFYPRLHGIKCHSGTVYTFSGYSVLDDSGPGPTGAAAVGIMWFNDDQNGYFNVERDFISKTESDPREREAKSLSPDQVGPFKRYSVDSQAPVSLRGQPHVFAVPYFVFADTFDRYVSACMFNTQLNTADALALPAFQYLRLGVPVETLSSEYVLGEDR